MKTEIEYLALLDTDLRQAATRERWRKETPPAPRRSRWAGFGTVAAGLLGLLVVAGLIGLIATNGGLGRSSDESGSAASGAATGATGAAGSGASATSSPSLEQVVPDPSAPGGDVSKIIRDGSMSIRLPKDGFSDGFATATRIAQNNGGFVLSSQIHGQRRGELTLRIPAKRFDEAMLALREIGVVQAQSITGKDVTAQFIDHHARLENLVAQRTVLRGLMAEATTIQETITVQNRLSQVELQIEQIQGQLNVIEDRVAEATVRVEIHEQDAPELRRTDVVENPSLGSAWDRAIQGFLNVVSAVVIGLGYLLPLAAIGVVVWFVMVSVRRRRAAN